MPVTHSYCYDDYATTKIEHNHFTLVVTSLTYIHETIAMTLSHFILAGITVLTNATVAMTMTSVTGTVTVNSVTLLTSH